MSCFFLTPLISDVPCNYFRICPNRYILRKRFLLQNNFEEKFLFRSICWESFVLGFAGKITTTISYDQKLYWLNLQANKLNNLKYQQYYLKVYSLVIFFHSIFRLFSRETEIDTMRLRRFNISWSLKLWRYL